MNARHRKNLLKLAAYLEGLPSDYSHFDMRVYTDHSGLCDLPMPMEIYAAKRPTEFLSNCGTVACAVGHGPAAGIRLIAAEIDEFNKEVYWPDYADRAFGMDKSSREDDGPFEFLFSGLWKTLDNHHYGAAARIRYFLDTGGYDEYLRAGSIKLYAPYRKGSRSAKRREIDAALAGEAGTAATVKQGAVHEHATAQPERPNPTPILPKKER